MFARFFGRLDQAPKAAGSRVNSRVYFFEGLYKAGLPLPAISQEPA
jgi:hypothetical protein